ncbi:hypothetical protein EYW49_11100 [Siculibacillus lacustris]|uniref:Transcriptional activator HlyU n=1 Tax=Siculibacillus lacustris TaxID=1549641 RepID=A0A4Q9VPH8_9HYPH|nr:HlyU family transcriptional regulator [Siculibacillus lacustris]TBW37645.1 hypothetical protein EYW49_11100 [Siculibacillus lacustris]
MSFLKRLFGLGGGADEAGAAAPKAAASLEHEGYVIRATPFKDGGQWQLCGVIAKEIDGTLREYRFVRADRFGDVDTAVEMAFVKARLIIAEQGDRIFG